ncbi:hypothetical protein PLICBS_009190 [Purpureocillium lilacinum]|uniref:uncharacterized protein n=1 Tax=Purpureocillium lilacinum TaxID=33203 RepID=UPI0020867DFF|nr:hypothetical protein PLICBS_009190 [Purpureocillium lilacinum]
MQDEQPVRLSLDQVETLILSLYQANPPEVISKAQATLAWFQGSPQAWPMIHQLLERPDDKVKFFGALTVIIKLNKESSSLSDGDATELLVRLVEWYSHSLARGRSGSLVSRKLSSAIATFFLHFHRLWPAYIRHLLVCLAARQSLDPSSVDETVGTADILARLDSAQLQAVTWVVTSVMEDAARFDMNAANNAGLYDAVMENTTDAVALMAVCLSPHLGDPAAHGDAVKCLQSWATFAQRASPGHGNIAASLRPLFEAVISSLSNTSLFDASAELIVDVLSNYPSLMTNTQYEYLATLFTAPWAQERYEKLLQGDFDFDSVQFGHLLLGFGEAKAEALIQGSDGNGQHLLSLLCGLLTAVGYPVAEDRIFVPAVEFWSTFAETMADYIHLDGHETSSPWAASAMAQLLEAVSRAWQKITYPPSEEYSQWDSVDRIGFNDARKDVIDFLQSAYTLAGPQLVATFADLTLSALSRSAWLPLEAAAFCLGGLADCGRDDVRFDAALTPVFASPLFSVLRDNSQGGVHPRSRQTCLSLIEQYNEYFERNVEFLAPALRLLFTLLSEQSMAASASKSILRLCSSCRHHLYSETEGFLDEYAGLIDGRQLDCISSEKVLGAIASVAQAIPDSCQRYRACARLLEFIFRDVYRSRHFDASSAAGQNPCQGLRCFDSTSDEHPSLHLGLRALRSLVSIGKGFQSPSDSSIDVDSTGRQLQVSSDGLEMLHAQIMRILQEMEGAFGQSSEMIELISSVLRSGFSENEPEPENDPELSQNGIEFASRLLSKSPVTVLSLQPSDATEFLFLFTLRVLDGKEPLPKGAAADFWSTYVSLTGNEELQQAIKGSMVTLGPLLAQSLARNFGGNASRSELDKLSEPLKKLVSRHAGAKDWLQTALNDGSFPSSKVSAEQKSAFVKKVISLRGARATNQVVRDFWLSARGSNFAYVS